MKLRRPVAGNDAANPAPMGLAEWLASGAVLGCLSGGLVAAADVQWHAPGLLPRDALVALAFGAAPGVIAGALLALALRVALALCGHRPARRTATALLAATMTVALACAVVLVVARGYRNVRGLPLCLAALPVAALIGGVALRLGALQRPGRAVNLGLAGSLALLAGVGGSAAAAAWGLPLIARLGVALLSLVWMILFGLMLPRAGPRTSAALLAAATGLSALLAVRGQPAAPHVAGVQRSADRSTDPSGAPRPPNVVLIVLDTTRRDRLGCYGHAGGLTPALDALAAEGVVYEDAFSTAPWTMPSHASMFTGLYPVTHGCTYEHHIWLDDQFETLAEMLKARGYRSAALVSNNHLSRANMFQGFDELVYLKGRYESLALAEFSRRLGLPDHWVDKGGYEARDELAQCLSTGKHDRPLFLFVNLFEPHTAYYPPLAWRAAHLPRPVGYWEATRFVSQFDTTAAHSAGRSDAYARSVIGAMYDALIAYQDTRLSELLEVLSQCSDLDNTLLIVTADHGENLGEAGRWDHVFGINDALIRIPLVIRYPRLFPPGHRVSGICQIVDFVPTVLDVLGEPLVQSQETKQSSVLWESATQRFALPGRTLVPERFVAREVAYADVAPFLMDLRTVELTRGSKAGVGHFNAHLRVMHTGSLKYVWASDGQHALYDVLADPDETRNLIDARPDAARELHEKLLAWWQAQPAYVRPVEDTPPQPFDRETIDRLRSLGYLD